MVRKVGIPKSIKTANAIPKKVRKQRPLVNSIKTECKEAIDAFSTTRKTAIQNGIKPVPSLLKGVGGFAKQVGPIPFITASLGFFTLIPGATATGLITGLVAKKGIKTSIALINKILKKTTFKIS